MNRKRQERTPFPAENKKGNNGSDKRGYAPALQVGNTFHVRIEEMSHDDEGIVHLAGYSVFVKNTVQDEDVTIKIVKVMKTVAHAVRL